MKCMSLGKTLFLSPLPSVYSHIFRYLQLVRYYNAVFQSETRRRLTRWLLRAPQTTSLVYFDDGGDCSIMVLFIQW